MPNNHLQFSILMQLYIIHIHFVISQVGSSVTFKDAPIIVYTIGKYKFLFLIPKVNKHESAFRFW